MANPNYIFTGVPTATVRIVVGDAAQSFAAALIKSGNKNAIGAFIVCEDNSIRWCVGGAVPTTGVDGLGHIMAAATSIKLSNPKAIESFAFLNAAAQSIAVLQVTFEFELGA